MDIPGFPAGSSLARLASIFHLQPTDTSAVLFRLGEVMKLPGQIRSAVTNSPNMSDTFTDVLPDLDQYLRSLLTGLANQGLPLPHETLVITLKLCSEQLAIHSPEQMPSTDELAAIRAEFENLLQELISIDIDEALKAFLLEEISSILYAIDGFTISGVSGIRDALASFFGELQIRTSTEEAFENKSDITPFSDRLWAAIERLASVVGLSVAANTLAHSIIQALTSGHGL